MHFRVGPENPDKDSQSEHISGGGKNAGKVLKRLSDASMRHFLKCTSDAGTRTRVARVKAEYPNQLDYSGYASSL